MLHLSQNTSQTHDGCARVHDIMAEKEDAETWRPSLFMSVTQNDQYSIYEAGIEYLVIYEGGKNIFFTFSSRRFDDGLVLFSCQRTILVI